MFPLQSQFLCPPGFPLAAARPPAARRMVYFSFLDSWLGMGGREQVPHLSAQQLFLETAERGTIWLLRRLEPDSSDQGRPSAPRLPSSWPCQPSCVLTAQVRTRGSRTSCLCIPHSHLLAWTGGSSDQMKIQARYQEELKKLRMWIQPRKEKT